MRLSAQMIQGDRVLLCSLGRTGLAVVADDNRGRFAIREPDWYASMIAWSTVPLCDARIPMLISRMIRTLILPHNAALERPSGSEVRRLEEARTQSVCWAAFVVIAKSADSRPNCLHGIPGQAFAQQGPFLRRVIYFEWRLDGNRRTLVVLCVHH